MPTCPRCGATHEPEGLTRHERAGTLVVHCPDCNFPLGRYRDPAG